MNVFGITTLSNSYSSYGLRGEERVSPSNPFIIERYYPDTGRVYFTSPNWAFIIPFIIVCLAIVITAAVLIYRNWRKKNCHPIYFAGKVKYARKGETVYNACECDFPNFDFLKEQTRRLIEEGHQVKGLYTDPDLTIPLDKQAKVNAPLYIYPKIKK